MTSLSPTAAAAIRHAERLCETRSQRLTALRRKTIEALADAGKPVKAYDLLTTLGQPNSPAKPASAYRTLEFLEELGLVHRVAGINAFVLCAHGGGSHVTCLYVCDTCGNVDECDGHSAPPEETPHGFSITRSVVEHYGLCSECSSSNDN